jgi:raffinose/stachyose/melibiose transport system permease protein
MSTRGQLAFNHVLLALFAVFALYPIVNLFFIAVNSPRSLQTGLGWPDDPRLRNFVDAWQQGGFRSAFVGSMVIAVTVVVIASVLSTLAGYAFGTMRFHGRETLFVVFVLGLIIPMESIIVPLYYDLRRLNLVDSYWSVILPQVAGSIAFGTFWMRTFFLSSPRSLIEAAKIDGASHLAILRRVLLPSARPALQTMAVLLFMGSFNDFLLPLVMLQGDESARTVPLAVLGFIGKREVDTNLLAAAGILATLPVVLLYLFSQRSFIQGMMTGAVKE